MPKGIYSINRICPNCNKDFIATNKGMDYCTRECKFFDSFIPEPNSGCWLWIHGLAHFGYGKMEFDKKTMTSHRVSAIIHGLKPKENDVVRHKCDVACFVNPQHLIIGTTQDNIDDRNKRGRTAKGEKSGNSKLTEKQVREILLDQRDNAAIGREYGVRRSCVRSIKIKKTWKHLK